MIIDIFGNKQNEIYCSAIRICDQHRSLKVKFSIKDQGNLI